MAEQSVLHKRSVAIIDGNPKLPSSSQLEYGEIAINYAKGVETISLKNNENEIVEFKNKEYFENLIEEEVQILSGKADVAEENAKNYADELNASMNNRVTVIESWGFATNADVNEILNGTYTPSPEEPNQSTGTITENNSIVIDETQLENGSYKLRYIDSEDNIIENFNEITTFEINK